MREDESNWFARWEEELPSPDELMPISQTLITPDLALAFDIRNPLNHNQQAAAAAAAPPPPPPPLPSPSGNPSSLAATSSEFAAEESTEFGSGGNGDDQARTLKRPRLVWTPQLHKRFVDAVAHLGIKNAVPKTIMQLMSVDGLTRENVASHLQKYRLYLKRMQGLSSGGAGVNGHGGGGGGGGDSATDRLFASSPVPAHFLHPVRPSSDHFMPFVPVTALQHHHHHHQQQMAAAAAVAHPQYHRQFDHPFLARQTPPQLQQQPLPRMGPPVHNAEDLESSANGGRKVLTLFPTADD